MFIFRYSRVVRTCDEVVAQRTVHVVINFLMFSVTYGMFFRQEQGCEPWKLWRNQKKLKCTQIAQTVVSSSNVQVKLLQWWEGIQLFRQYCTALGMSAIFVFQFWKTDYPLCTRCINFQNKSKKTIHQQWGGGTVLADYLI